MWIHSYIINIQRCFLAFYCFYVSLAVTHIYINNHHHAIVHHLFLPTITALLTTHRTAKAHRRRSWAGIPLLHAQQSTPEIANPSGKGDRSFPEGRAFRKGEIEALQMLQKLIYKKCDTKLDVAVSASMCVLCIYIIYIVCESAHRT